MSERQLPIDQNTELVSFTLKVDGTELDRIYDVVSISVNKEINRVPTARIQIIDGDASMEDFVLSASDTLIPGKEVEILAGYHMVEETIFKGLIVKHGIRVRGHSSLLIIECKDAVMKTTVGIKSRYFTEQKDSDVISTILGDYSGISPTIESSSVSHKELVQFKSTDWDFILSRADANGMVCIADDGNFAVKVPKTGSPVGELLFGANIIEFDGSMDARDQFKAVKAKAWDYASQSLVEVDGADPSWTVNSNLPASDLAKVVDASSFDLIHNGQVVQEELQAWADATLLRARMSQVRGRVRTIGLAIVKPGTTITLAGLGDRMNGDAYVTGVRHEIANGEWLTDTQIGLDPRRYGQTQPIHHPGASDLLPAIQGLQTGVVTQIHEDPDGENRILIKVPTISAEDEGIWARVATLDAGAERGTFFLPEVDDEVVLGFLNGDPRDPVVLGMLHSSTKAAPFEAADTNPQKGYMSREKLQLLFDDELKVIHLETPGGNKMDITDDGKGFLLEDQNGNKLTMNADGISLESAKDIILKATGDVKIEGINVEAKASANFKAEGSGGAEVSTSAIAVLKGSLVQIN